MIPVLKTENGFKVLVGNPVLLSLDGEEKAPLLVLLHESWNDEARARFGVYLVEPAEIPEGKRAVGGPSYEMVKGKVVQTVPLEDIPVEPEQTPEQKVERMASRYGLTLDELKGVLVP